MDSWLKTPSSKSHSYAALHAISLGKKPNYLRNGVLDPNQLPMPHFTPTQSQFLSTGRSEKEKKRSDTWTRRTPD